MILQAELTLWFEFDTVARVFLLLLNLLVLTPLLFARLWQRGPHPAAADLQCVGKPGRQVPQEHGAALGRAGRQHHRHQPAAGS